MTTAGGRKVNFSSCGPKNTDLQKGFGVAVLPFEFGDGFRLGHDDQCVGLHHLLEEREQRMCRLQEVKLRIAFLPNRETVQEFSSVPRHVLCCESQKKSPGEGKRTQV